MSAGASRCGALRPYHGRSSTPTNTAQRASHAHAACCCGYQSSSSPSLDHTAFAPSRSRGVNGVRQRQGTRQEPGCTKYIRSRRGKICSVVCTSYEYFVRHRPIPASNVIRADTRELGDTRRVRRKKDLRARRTRRCRGLCGAAGQPHGAACTDNGRNSIGGLGYQAATVPPPLARSSRY